MFRPQVSLHPLFTFSAEKGQRQMKFILKSQKTSFWNKWDMNVLYIITITDNCQSYGSFPRLIV